MFFLDWIWAVRPHAYGSGRTRLGAEGEEKHDDLVMALALACWSAKGRDMSGKEHDDCLEKTVEERLAEAALREELRERGRPCGAEGRYLRADDYDPVLRAHCRLD